jgi:type IV pilus assembly protein PilY1
LDLQLDNTVSFYFDTDNQVTRVKSFGNDATGKPNTGPIIKSFDEVKSLWEAGKFLYVLPPVDRRIFTVINEYNTTIVPGVGSTAFTTGNTSGSFRNKLGVTGGSGSEDNVINYVRGLDSPAFRNRTVQYPNFDSPDNVWKLGDIINSTPRVVASVPLNTYDQVNRDYTYKLFINGTNRNTYKDRGMVFVGANDGMLHAFKLGKLTFPTGNNLIKAQLEGTELGSEQWAFIPKNALPYLQALQDNNYCHLYYVDQAPQVFDASIAAGSVASTSTTPRDESHWATILIGGMRLGGACRTSAVTCTSSDNCVASPVSDGGLSSYFAMDVTDPTSPKVLWEFPDKDRTDYSYPPSSSPLGFATTGPAIVRINDGGDGTKGKWFAVFGSGPTGPIQSRQFLAHSDQPLRLFIVDLITGKLVRTIEQYGPPGAQAPISSAFAGSMINSTADFNQDYSDDVLYIGYVQKNGTTNLWNNGGVIRLQTNGSINPDNWLASKVIENIGPVTSSVVHLQNNDTNKNWLFFGAGRYYFALPDSPDDDIAQRRLYGIQDTCFNKPSNNSYVDNCSNIVTIADLTPRTTASNDAIANLGWYINLDPPTYIGGYLDNQAERVITDPLATTAGVVFFTTFRPYGAACAIGGKTFLWAVQYDTGGDPFYTAQGAALMNQMKAMMQVSTASVEQLDKTYFSGDASHRKSFAMEGVPPMAQGLSLLVPPPPVKRILHMIER